MVAEIFSHHRLFSLGLSSRFLSSSQSINMLISWGASDELTVCRVEQCVTRTGHVDVYAREQICKLHAVRENGLCFRSICFLILWSDNGDQPGDHGQRSLRNERINNARIGCENLMCMRDAFAIKLNSTWRCSICRWCEWIENYWGVSQ